VIDGPSLRAAVFDAAGHRAGRGAVKLARIIRCGRPRARRCTLRRSKAGMEAGMGTARSRALVGPAVERIEALDALDGPGKAAGKAIRDALPAGAVREALSGTWLGHALHPLMTDFTIGSFLSATLLDVLGGDTDGRAARRLIAIGLASYGPTVATGLGDWADAEIADARVRRVGIVHAVSNSVAVGCFASSLATRRAGRTGRGKLLSLGGLGALTVGGYLGAHLSYFHAVGPNQTAFDQVPEDWTPVANAANSREGQPATTVAGDTPVLLLRRGGALVALHDRCSHRGCSLGDGDFDGDVVTCACHGSQFSLVDGALLRGPATAPQPVYDARQQDGRIEIRARP
jgi:nitrite reductase/ring-hydroxylating ferredoxin subunit